MESPNPQKVMSETCIGIGDSHSGPLTVTISSKSSTHEWTFSFKTFKQLKAVALLQDTYRNHFYLKEISTNGSDVIINEQEWTFRGEENSDSVDDDLLEHHVTVEFVTEIFGTFRQSVVFDFGDEPVLVKHLCADVIPVCDMEMVNEIKSDIRPGAERWNPENADIVEFMSIFQNDSSYLNFENEWHQKLRYMYPCPSRSTFNISLATIKEPKFSKNNYKMRMHELLCVEEIARTELISKYNLLETLHITHSYILAPNSTVSSTAKYSTGGELFALLPLSRELSEDSAEGRLILKNCQTVLLAPEPKSILDPFGRRRVYEALIEDRCKNNIYIRLSAATVSGKIYLFCICSLQRYKIIC